MSRRVNTTALAKVLDALHLQQMASILALPYDLATPPPPPSTHTTKRQLSYTPQLTSQTSTEATCNELVRSTLLDCIEISGASSPRGSAASSSTALTRHEKGEAAASAPLSPKVEIGSALEGRRLQQLDLSSCRVTASFNRADLTDCLFVDGYFAKSTFNLATLHRGNLSGARFQSCVFHGTEARAVVAVGARFSHCVFVRADLRDWDVRGATFYHCRFTLCDLSAWLFDGQTSVVQPEDWSRCRRIAWRAAPHSSVGECRVVGVDTRAASLPPRAR